jgi:hypothetical protein
MPLEQAKYTLSDFTLEIPAGVINEKTELTVETDPQFFQRKTGKKGVNVYNGDNPPKLTLKYINSSELMFDDSGIADGYPVEQFDFTSDNDSDVSAIANLQTAFPVDGATRKWVWGKKSTTINDTGDTVTTVEVMTNCVNWNT